MLKLLRSVTKTNILFWKNEEKIEIHRNFVVGISDLHHNHSNK